MPRNYKLPENPSYYRFGHGADAVSSAAFFFGLIPHLPEVDADFVTKELTEKARQIRAKQAEVAALEADLTGVSVRTAKYINKHWTPAEIQAARDIFLAAFRADRKAKDDDEALNAIKAVLDPPLAKTRRKKANG